VHIVFVHGLRQTAEDWNLFSPYIAEALKASSSEITYVSALSRGDPDQTATQLEMLLLDAVAKHDEVCIVAYSLGGLVARLLLSEILTGKRKSQRILARLVGVVTLGTPLNGPRRRWMRRTLGLCPWVDFIGRQSGAKRIDYETAIEAAKKNDLPRPRFHHIEFADDRWSGAHRRELYTEDDVAAGEVVGPHTGFAADRRARDVSAHVIREIRKVRSKGPKRSTGAHPTLEKVTSIILISCSATKSDADQRPFGQPFAGDWLSDRNLVDDLLAKRSSILSKIQDSLIEDKTYGQGNRGDKIANRRIVQGADFGFKEIDDEIYLRACHRYTGRLFGPLASIDWNSFHDRAERPLILIMSGLYGLVQSDEMIQNYDVHLSDIEQTTGSPLRGLWTGWYTDALNSLVKGVGGKVRIFDLMADRDYTGAIAWSSLDRSACSVYHLLAHNMTSNEDRTDKSLLVPAGAVLAGIINNPGTELTLERSDAGKNRAYPIEAFYDGDIGAFGNHRVAFERAIVR
jgi:cytoplasmic iron level regulating protein YaaA (DUF328/UPF0246 family)